jgi:hypothetical protein
MSLMPPIKVGQTWEYRNGSRGLVTDLLRLDGCIRIQATTRGGVRDANRWYDSSWIRGWYKVPELLDSAYYCRDRTQPYPWDLVRLLDGAHRG